MLSKVQVLSLPAKESVRASVLSKKYRFFRCLRKNLYGPVCFQMYRSNGKMLYRTSVLSKVQILSLFAKESVEWALAWLWLAEVVGTTAFRCCLGYSGEEHVRIICVPSSSAFLAVTALTAGCLLATRNVVS